MPLKASIKSLEEVPEILRGEYKKVADDQYVLDVDEKDYKASLSEFRLKNVDLLKREKDWVTKEDRLKAFGDMDPVTARKALEVLGKLEAEEEKTLLKDGKFDDVFNQRTEKMQESHRKAMEAKDKALETTLGQNLTYKSRLGSLMIDTEVNRTIGKFGSPRQGALTDILNRARGSFQVSEDGLKIVPLDSSGNAVYGTNGKELTMDEWAQTLVKESSYLFDPAKGGGAGGGQNSQSTQTKNTIDGSDPLAFGRNLKDIVAGKVIVSSQT